MKTVSSKKALTILLIFSAVAMGVIIFFSQKCEKESDAFSYKMFNSANLKKKAKGKEACRARTFQGDVSVRGKLVKEDVDTFLEVQENDLEKLPLYENTSEFKENNSKVKLIEVPAVLKKKISGDAPVEVGLKGYVSRCGKTPLASTEYRDDIFKDFLESQI